ncbi:endonuclease/exonuclease/phosphatase family protein [Pseudomonas agarici]|uniref:endonuclease/exonuclease/phosphatase family protein n=1 Tax=Pseudomonas agarici TaxID=46677 RepID=UPI0015A3FFBA|nr:endonuclease/exonuclease/phosphatase family protein [Pseudomonas agarici]NWB91589.1 endonuclease/exonuclease/phosphatase family protein [Pseudomonas agarici]
MVATENSPPSQTITLGWWNTSLAPSGKSRACEELRTNAVKVIAYLFLTSKVDFMALGEISTEDFDHLKNNPIFKDFAFLSGVSKAGKSKFDICYIFNPNKITFLNLENVTSIKGNGTLKIAQRLDVIHNDSETIFNIFASHWPSRLWCQENHADRYILGIRLRDAVDKILENSISPPHIILLGDYNDDPFNDSLSQQLMATRDFELVQKRKHLFYNPYWSRMGQGNGGRGFAGGSYFYHGGDITRWHTFDQIIYSHAFISEKKWKLANHNPHIIEIPGLAEQILSRASKFDHLPVCGTIEKVA